MLAMLLGETTCVVLLLLEDPARAYSWVNKEVFYGGAFVFFFYFWLG
jgi:hypothetical protein